VAVLQHDAYERSGVKVVGEAANGRYLEQEIGICCACSKRKSRSQLGRLRISSRAISKVITCEADFRVDKMILLAPQILSPSVEERSPTLAEVHRARQPAEMFQMGQELHCCGRIGFRETQKNGDFRKGSVGF
jgi:hypothetical protein